MTEKSAQELNKLNMIKNLLREGKELLDEIVVAEEQMQEIIVQGDHETITSSQNYRDALQVRIDGFKEMALSLNVDHEDITALVEVIDQDEEREQFLGLYDAVTDTIRYINVLQSINGNLLREWFSFIKSMQKNYLPGEEMYDNRGALKDILDKEIRNIDKSC